MKRNYQFWVYMLASRSGTLYIGMTNNLKARVSDHKSGKNSGFTKKYKCHNLVWFEEHQYVLNAMQREVQLKKWVRRKKEALINTINPDWNDLAADWFENSSIP